MKTKPDAVYHWGEYDHDLEKLLFRCGTPSSEEGATWWFMASNFLSAGSKRGTPCPLCIVLAALAPEDRSE